MTAWGWVLAVIAVAAELVTVPVTFTVPCGAAMAGFIEVMAMATLPGGACCRPAAPAAASAGTAAASAQPTARVRASSPAPARRSAGRAGPGQC